MSYVLLQYTSCLTVKTKTYLLILQYTTYTTGKYVLLYMEPQRGLSWMRHEGAGGVVSHVVPHAQI